ncbi:MAG: HTH-type transcriptional regulator ImmR [Syntrophorhabdus sp. PtaU1.Bin002]|nr:MAG: HTH-type transcriptional regulator ImmR [Syntrophorhabdus sp. PtaB.Bin006]OPY73970.1 MAG: HTH-type transcriptional regulator ImmR [Syntrophorhabdus sp. PtaU1.Bin002]OPY73980.1 MAG: HTH-type transcriptional regulator ImmR [Syntrophorhabdus sp. PtaU1.Bin002]
MAMPRRSRLSLPPLDLGEETIGQRLARLRKERGYTQAELSEKLGIIQALISDYEKNKLRLHAEMVIRFAQALEVTSDELLGLNGTRKLNEGKASLRLLRRSKKIEELPSSQQKTLLKTIDTFLKGAGK